MQNGRKAWYWKAQPKPWPLYRLDRLTAAAPDSWVIVVEGGGKCEAAERLFPDCVVTAWMGGANSVDLSDWTILRRFREERLIWWHDADRPSEDGKPHGCLRAAPAFRAKFPRASFADTSGLSDIKDGWDVKDLEAEGCDDPVAWLMLVTEARSAATMVSGAVISDAVTRRTRLESRVDQMDQHRLPPPTG